MAEPVFIVELEEKIVADTNGAYKKQLLEQLSNMEATLVARQRVPNDRKTHLEIQSALQAVKSAKVTLEVVSK